MEPEESRKLPRLLAVALVAVAAGGAMDLVLDAPASWRSFHVLYEVFLIVGGLALASTLWLGWWRAEREVGRMRRSLAERQAERDAWQATAQKSLEGLGRAIDQQFDQWRLTPAEREVALHLLKGHSHRTTGRLTGRSERTVRQHAVALYQKAGLSGRAELGAFFLEGVSLPDSTPD